MRTVPIKDVHKLLNERFGDYSLLDSHDLGIFFDSSVNIDNASFDLVLSFLKKALAKVDINEVLVIPGAFFYSNSSLKNPTSFNSLDEFFKFFSENFILGVNEWYILPKSLDFAIFICHDESLHIGGSTEVINLFKNYLK